MHGRLRRSLPPLAALVLVAGLAACGGGRVASVEVRRVDPAPQRLLLRDVAVFDPERLTRREGLDVVVEGGRIAALRPAGEATVDAGTRVIEGAGGTLLPGLIDMHGHVHSATGPVWERRAPDPEGNLRAYLYAGVTTVFDPSDASDEAFRRRDRVARGDLIGPRIFTTGPALTCEHGHPRAMIEELAPAWIAWTLLPRVATAVDGPESAARVVDELAGAGADAVKIVVDRIPLEAPRMRLEVARAIVRRARAHGLPTVAHVGTTRDAIDAAEAGVALWVHGVYKERIPDGALARLAEYGIPMVTTSEVFDRYGRSGAGPIEPTRLEREMVPQEVLDSFFPIPEDFEPGPFQAWLDLMAETEEARRDNVRRLHAAGMTLLAGSDVQSGVFPGASLHRELATLVASGLSPAEALRAATLDPARFLAQGGEPDSGLVAPGKRADLLLVNGDPTRDIAALADIREVILEGVPLERTPVR